MASTTRETLDDLLRNVLSEDRFTAWCAEAGLRPWTVLRLRTGQSSRVHAGTVAALASKLRIPRDRVRAAIDASRDHGATSSTGMR